ncbi:MAG: NAD-dependent epimerase/dehydratase family protein [Candidatus Bathyarchaeia archaeon]
MLQEKLKDARVLVTGGAGFIGSEVTRQLVRGGARVTVLDNLTSGKKQYLEGLPVRVVRADICDKRTISRCVSDQEIVYHLAALPFIPDSYLNPQEFFRVNVEGTLNLLWKAIHSESVKRFVYISSSEVYGTAQRIPMDEDHPTQPHSTYAVSKLAADRAVFTLHKEQDFPVVILRPFNSYGPRITQPYIIPEIAIQLLEGRGHLKLGNVESSRDFTFVEDTARAIILASLTDRAVGEVINIGSGTETKIQDLAALIAKIIKTKFVLDRDKSRIRPYDVDRLICNNSKARNLLGWKPEVQLEDGLTQAVDWIRKNKVKFKAPFKGAVSWYRSS